MIGEEDDISPGLPLVRLVVLAADKEEEEEEAEEEGRGSRVGDWVAGGVLGTPVGDGRRVREYVRSAGAAVEVSLGGDGMSMCGEAAVVPGILGLLVVDTEGAGVRGGGGEEVVGVRVGAGESKSMGLGVSLGGVRVEGAEQSGVLVWGLVPPAASLCSDWLCRTSSLSILQRFRTLENISKQINKLSARDVVCMYLMALTRQSAQRVQQTRKSTKVRCTNSKWQEKNVEISKIRCTLMTESCFSSW